VVKRPPSARSKETMAPQEKGTSQLHARAKTFADVSQMSRLVGDAAIVQTIVPHVAFGDNSIL
jgi:hypothetical protein